MKTEVFIAGAGLSGLSLAAALDQKGIDFCLAEARDRIGGRILSTVICSGGKESAKADLGPSWIWPGQPLVKALLDNLGIRVFEQYSSGFMVYENELGEVRRDLDYAPMAGSLRIEGGTSLLTERLMESIGSCDIRLSHRLRLLRQDSEGYQVNLSTPDGEVQLMARKVVLAIPPELVAADIEFAPLLPPNVLQEMQSIPTWMAGQAKFFATYKTPFWREQGLSGDAMSRRGPLGEIHDASPADAGCGALFGFVDLPAGSELREPATVKTMAIDQLERLFGPHAGSPLEVILQDWFREEFTATGADRLSNGHPGYGTLPGMAELASNGLLFASSEMATQFGGLIEGALEASGNVQSQLWL